MAGIPLGAQAPASSPSLLDPWNAPLLPAVPTSASTRKRRNHGVFGFGAGVASVYSSRRATDGDAEGVSLVLMDGGSRMLSGGMSPVQARSMARALVSAAAAVESLQLGGAA